MKRTDRGRTPWGLYSMVEDRWLDVVFANRRDAEEAEALLASRQRNAAG